MKIINNLSINLHTLRGLNLRALYLWHIPLTFYRETKIKRNLIKMKISASMNLSNI